jgi:hypothetical protein
MRRGGLSDDAAATHFGVSPDLLKWRIRMTGIDYQLAAALAANRPECDSWALRVDALALDTSLGKPFLSQPSSSPWVFFIAVGNPPRSSGWGSGKCSGKAGPPSRWSGVLGVDRAGGPG